MWPQHDAAQYSLLTLHLPIRPPVCPFGIQVPPGHATAQTAALLDGLLAMPDALAGEANQYVSVYRPVPNAGEATAVDPAVAAAGDVAAAADEPVAAAAGVAEPAADTPAATAKEPAAANVAAGADATSAEATTINQGDTGGAVSAASTTCFSYRAGGVTARSLARNAAGGDVTANGLWGLERVEERSRVYDGAYRYSTSGAGANVFVVDTGVQVGVLRGKAGVALPMYARVHHQRTLCHA